jgi:dATP pyrophosphohydrolase
MKIWQGISGGVEGEETLLETAKRECYEEARINKNNQFIQLDSISSIPRYWFNYKWDENIFVVKEHSFGVRVDNLNLKISSEHTEFKWVEYSEAKNMLRSDGNKTALWELHERLKIK